MDLFSCGGNKLVWKKLDPPACDNGRKESGCTVLESCMGTAQEIFPPTFTGSERER